MTTINNRQFGEGYVRPKKEQRRSGRGRATSNHSPDHQSINPDPVAGWYAQAKSVRMNPLQPRGGKRVIEGRHR